MKSAKRNRPFSATEVNKLLELLEKYKNSIENKKSDVETTKIKEDAWVNVTNEFNSTNEIGRDIKELKTKYKNMRYSTKSKMAIERRNSYGTGGGPATTEVFSQHEEACRNLLPEKETFGLENVYDADAIEIIDNFLQISPKCKTPSVKDQAAQMAECTPASGPSTLRAPISASLKVPKKQTNKTSWTKLADIKSKWAELKMDADMNFAKRALEQMEERHQLEMEILQVRLEKEKLQLEKEKRNL